MSRTVVVVGGGYGGAAVAKALESKADVVLIDPRDAFVNAPGHCGRWPSPTGRATCSSPSTRCSRGAR